MQIRLLRPWLARTAPHRVEDAGEDGARCFANPTRAPRDRLERFVLGYLAARGPVSRAVLVAAVAEWLAQRERGMAAGVADLGVWRAAMWREQAAPAVDGLAGDLIGVV